MNVGFFTWDTEDINSGSSYFTRTTNNQSIKILKAGTYFIAASVLQSDIAPGTRGDVYLYKNNYYIDESLGISTLTDGYIKHNLTTIVDLDVNDEIKVYAVQGNRYGTDVWTQLSIQRLN